MVNLAVSKIVLLYQLMFVVMVFFKLMSNAMMETFLQMMDAVQNVRNNQS
jgi:hypothetical protein